MHKAFLACTIIGSTPSILGRLLCPSQHSPLPCTWGIPLHRQSQADKNIIGPVIMSADLIMDTKMVEWYVFRVIIPIRIMQLSCEKGAQYMYRPPKHIILIMRKVCLWRSPEDWIHIYQLSMSCFWTHTEWEVGPSAGNESPPLDKFIAESRQYNVSLEWILLSGKVKLSLIF